jgi:hypothetical protein
VPYLYAATARRLAASDRDSGSCRVASLPCEESSGARFGSRSMRVLRSVRSGSFDQSGSRGGTC